MRRHITAWKKIIARNTSDDGQLLKKKYKELLKLTLRK
jgi:hypothetical protein